MSDEVTPAPSADFPIVGIGASAGGLEAFTQLLQCLPEDTGLGFVLIQHLDRTHPSLLSEALSKATRMPVRQAEQGMQVESDHVYVIAPNTDLALHEGKLVLSPRAAEVGKSHLPVDFFLQSLASQLGSQAIGVVLSGSASDGTEGLRAIRACDGITFAQNPRSAKYSGMPQSAIDAGVVDYVMDIPRLAEEIVRVAAHPYVRSSAPKPSDVDQAARDEIFAHVRNQIGVDFSEFKASTVARRLARRLLLRRVADLPAYSKLLEAEPDETLALYEDMLIHVTSFFRDPEVFEALRAHVFPEILKDKPDGAMMRAWVAGCSTGEEVYSLAIAWIEFAETMPGTHPIKIFGSDLSELSIQKARTGVYSDGTMAGISEERCKRFFTKVDGGHRINKSVRDQCVFVRHNLVRDPPFSKLDLVSCRNVRIYFDQTLQKKVLPTLHYCLNQPGYLLLGRSENIAGFNKLFSASDETNKIFLRNGTASNLRFAPQSDVTPYAGKLSERSSAMYSEHNAAYAKHLDRLLLSRYCPPGVLINENMDVLLFRGRTGAYLQAAPGPPQSNLIGMARSGLISALRATIAQAKQDGVVVRCPNVEVDHDGQTKRCDMLVVPFSGMPEGKEPLFVVLFEEPGAIAAGSNTMGEAEPVERRLEEGETNASPERRRNVRLEHELATTKEYLQTLIAEHGRTNDEIGTANEELVSGNEELQSMNEELETAKEELQSINEELTTLNEELQRRNLEVEKLMAEAELARSEAERANRSKDDFLATLSHELRTPLSSMLLNSQRLRSGDTMDRATLQRTGESLERATWSQMRLIDDLLDVSRIVADKLTLDCRPVDLAAAVRISLESFAPIILEKSLKLRVSLEPAQGAIWADFSRAQQVISNVLSNAFKFTPDGGSVTIVVDTFGSVGRLCVTDTGIGINPGFLTRVFARFSQSDSSITRTHGGLGLGLSLVQRLVEMQGGSVKAQSEGLGKGASFTVTFPLVRMAEKASIVEQSSGVGRAEALDRPGKTRHYDALEGLRVLVVDDDVWTREAVLEVLRFTGAIVETAPSAEVGLAALEKFDPQVIVCDIAMPIQDGYTFMRKVRVREATVGGKTPALALTALATEEDRRKALAAGFQLHLAKPIDIDRLRDAVLQLSLMITSKGDREAPAPVVA